MSHFTQYENLTILLLLLLLLLLKLSALSDYYWRGFLGSNLSSVQLLVFALLTFLYAPVGIKIKLVSHLMTGGVLFYVTSVIYNMLCNMSCKHSCFCLRCSPSCAHQWVMRSSWSAI
jgi:hypothetical protein